MIRGLGRDFLVTLDLAARKSLLSDLRNGASVAIEKDELTRLHCQNALLDFKDIVLS